MTENLLERNDTQNAVFSGDEDARQYLHEIRQYPLLTPGDELELAKRCASGDEEAVRHLVNSNLRLVVSIARGYSGRGVPLLDLIQEGSIGLMIAARKFDYTLDFRFSTYASKWIRQRIGRCLLNNGAMIRVPGHTAERIRKLLTAQAGFISEFGRLPTGAELSEATGFSEQKVEQLLQLSPEICSLDAPVGEDGESTVGKLLPDDEDFEPQAVLIRQEMNTVLDALLSQLNERQQRLLRLRFGMEDGVCYSLSKIGEKLNISKERARQIEQQAIRRLNKLGAELGLEDFLG